jgi:acetyl esterase
MICIVRIYAVATGAYRTGRTGSTIAAMNPSPLQIVKGAVLRIAALVLFSLPDGLVRRVFGEPPPVAAGLRADAWALARLADAVESDAATMTADELRAETEVFGPAVGAARPEGIRTDDFELGSEGDPLPARLYVPPAAGGPGPLLIWFHGGGWVVGSIGSHDRACAFMAVESGIRVLSVGYRLAPEHPFPAAPDDALLAWRAVHEDPGRFGAEDGKVAVGGDSAGANLATVLCHDLKGLGGEQPAMQLLVYPLVEVGSERPSFTDFASGFYLTSDRIDHYSAQYVSEDRADDPRVSPIKAEDLTGLAPAWVLTCVADPLRDEGEAYAERLREAGIAVRLDRLPLVHAWFNVTLSRSSRAAHAELGEGIRRFFRRQAIRGGDGDPDPFGSAD